MKTAIVFAFLSICPYVAAQNNTVLGPFVPEGTVEISEVGVGAGGSTTFVAAATGGDPFFAIPNPTVTFVEDATQLVVPTQTFVSTIAGVVETLKGSETCSLGSDGNADCVYNIGGGGNGFTTDFTITGPEFFTAQTFAPAPTGKTQQGSALRCTSGLTFAFIFGGLVLLLV